MNRRPIIDVGPALNFLASNQTRLLIGVLGRISTPETVQKEVLRKASVEVKFKAVVNEWSKLTPKWLEVLDDDWTALESVGSRLARMPLSERRKRAADLGELMVLAHALVAAEEGRDVTVIIDERAGAAMATAEARNLHRRRAAGKTVGRLFVVNTVTILEKAAHKGLVDGKSEMRSRYARLRELDDGLVPIESTPLLSRDLWVPQPS
ncbi:hypothetical protein AB0H71_06195 [Nocardia sp. NPDC050697]|uniref:hypothetical protein n=1 Tax=Nocardia sp. NPDC050697 TaxID=3155158 RepID=UPI0033F51214